MRRWLQGILLIISVILISIAIYSLMGMFRDYRKEHDMHEHLKQIHEQEKPQPIPEGDGGTGDSSEDTAETEDVDSLAEAMKKAVLLKNIQNNYKSATVSDFEKILS